MGWQHASPAQDPLPHTRWQVVSVLARLLFASEILLEVIDEDALVAPSPGVVIVDSLSPGPSPSGKAMVMVWGALLVGTSSYSSYPGGNSG